jgi:hypothetical protein
MARSKASLVFIWWKSSFATKTNAAYLFLMDKNKKA